MEALLRTYTIVLLGLILGSPILNYGTWISSVGSVELGNTYLGLQSVGVEPQESTNENPYSVVYLPMVIGEEKYPPDNRAFELELLRLINEQRDLNGLSPLREDSALTNAARRHAEDMAEHNLLSHTGSDGTRPIQRMVQEGYMGIAWGEAASFAPNPQTFFNAAMGSIPHRDILLDILARDIGIGFAIRQGRYTFVVDTGH